VISRFGLLLFAAAAAAAAVVVAVVETALSTEDEAAPGTEVLKYIFYLEQKLTHSIQEFISEF
jgi:hypothetical protein